MRRPLGTTYVASLYKTKINPETGQPYLGIGTIVGEITFDGGMESAVASYNQLFEALGSQFQIGRFRKVETIESNV